MFVQGAQRAGTGIRQEWRRMEYVQNLSTGLQNTKQKKNRNALRECTGEDSPRNKEMLTVWAMI